MEKTLVPVPSQGTSTAREQHSSPLKANIPRRFTELEGAETMQQPPIQCSKEIFTSLHSREHEEIPAPSNTLPSIKGSCSAVVLDPSCKDPVQMPTAVLGHVPAFVSKPVIDMQGKGTALCGQLEWGCCNCMYKST